MTETYLFSGDQYVKYSGWDYQYVDHGYPKLIAEGLPKEAVFENLPDEFTHRLKLMAENKIPFSGAIANQVAVYLFEEKHACGFSRSLATGRSRHCRP